MYRLWFVYGKKMKIIWFPIFLWLGGFVCTIMQIYLQVEHVHNPDFGPYQWAAVDMSVGPGIVLIPFWLSTIVLNAYCTGRFTIPIVKWQTVTLMIHILRSNHLENSESIEDGSE